MHPQIPPTYEEASSDDQNGKMPHRPAESDPVDQAAPVLPQYSPEYIQYMQQKDIHSYSLEVQRRDHLEFVLFCSTMVLLIFSVAYVVTHIA